VEEFAREWSSSGESGVVVCTMPRAQARLDPYSCPSIERPLQKKWPLLVSDLQSCSLRDLQLASQRPQAAPKGIRQRRQRSQGLDLRTLGKLRARNSARPAPNQRGRSSGGQQIRHLCLRRPTPTRHCSRLSSSLNTLEG
jgi:hypothetical protein